MTPDQRLKLAQALITEAVVCSDKNDIDEARHLTQLAVRHEFKEKCNVSSKVMLNYSR